MEQKISTRAVPQPIASYPLPPKQNKQKPSPTNIFPFPRKRFLGTRLAPSPTSTPEGGQRRGPVPVPPRSPLPAPRYLPAPCPAARTQPPGNGRQRLMPVLQKPGPAARVPRASRSVPFSSCRAKGGGSTQPISAGLVGSGSSPMGGRVVELRGR